VIDIFVKLFTAFYVELLFITSSPDIVSKGVMF